jgi:hypothetical protein
MDPKVVLLDLLSAALTRGQGGFTEEDLALAYEEIQGMLIQGQFASLVAEGKLDLRVSDGTILYSAAEGSPVPLAEPMPLETLIENVRSAEGK